jgi:nitrate reductase gamma subunit
VDAWIDWARGPLFWAALTFMILGLARHALITLFDIRRMLRRAGDKNVPYRQVARATLAWIVPTRKARNRVVLSVTSIVFHVAIIVVPLFLAGHIALIARGTGLSWPALPHAVADVLTFVALGAAVALVVQRALARASRSLSRFQDYAIPLAIAIPFASGLFVMHPTWSPFAFDVALLVHVLSADILLILVPMTKISHCVLLPLTQIVSELGWRFPPDAGSKVEAALGKEGEAI